MLHVQYATWRLNPAPFFFSVAKIACRGDSWMSENCKDNHTRSVEVKIDTPILLAAPRALMSSVKTKACVCLSSNHERPGWGRIPAFWSELVGNLPHWSSVQSRAPNDLCVWCTTSNLFIFFLRHRVMGWTIAMPVVTYLHTWHMHTNKNCKYVFTFPWGC